MMEQLERFENVLERVKMKPQIRLLNIVCDQKARKRVVTLTRSQRDEPLQFTLIGGESVFKKKFQKARFFFNHSPLWRGSLRLPGFHCPF